ncbi:hypothetical protein Bbelb_090760 [Branchiostoma belcheri]|nr:hypothetical protein Bbelb_090760 [Branchiostoma belcheri]
MTLCLAPETLTLTRDPTGIPLSRKLLSFPRIKAMIQEQVMKAFMMRHYRDESVRDSAVPVVINRPKAPSVFPSWCHKILSGFIAIPGGVKLNTHNSDPFVLSGGTGWSCRSIWGIAAGSLLLNLADSAAQVPGNTSTPRSDDSVSRHVLA